MNDQARRRELRARYKQTRPEAGVYRILNRRNSKYLLGSTPNLASLQGKLEFAKSLSSPNGLASPPSKDLRQLCTWLRGHYGSKDEDERLCNDLRQFGLDAFSLEVLEVLETKPESTQAEILKDLAALEELWREKLDPSLRY